MKRSFRFQAACLAILSVTALLSYPAAAQTRDQKVLQDRDKLADNENWVYDNLDAALFQAADQKKPLMVVLRCIP